MADTYSGQTVRLLLLIKVKPNVSREVVEVEMGGDGESRQDWCGAQGLLDGAD